MNRCSYSYLKLDSYENERSSMYNNNNDDLEVPHPQSGSSSTRFLIELEFENVDF